MSWSLNLSGYEQDADRERQVRERALRFVRDLASEGFNVNGGAYYTSAGGGESIDLLEVANESAEGR